MAKSYNLTLQLHMQGPSNIKAVAANIKKQLASANSGGLKVKIDPKSLSSIDEATKKIRAMTSALNQANAAGASVNAQFARMSKVLRTTQVRAKHLEKMQKTLVRTGKTLKQNTRYAKTFMQSISARIFNQAAWNAINGLITGLGMAFRQAGRDAVEFERNLNKVQQITNSSSATVRNLEKTIRDLSQSLGVSSQELSNVALTLTQAGIKGKQAEIALKALAAASLAPTFESMTGAVEGTIAVMSQFNIKADGLEQALDSINTVAGRFAVEFGDIVTAIQKGGGAFAAAAAGLNSSQESLAQFMALFTTVRATTRESADTIATGLRTITARLQRLSSQKKIQDILGPLELTKNGQFVGAYKAIELIAARIRELGISTQDVRFAAIAEEIGGIRQLSRVIPLLTEAATTQAAFNAAMNSSGSVAGDAQQAQYTYAIQLQKTKEAWNDLISAFATNSTLKGLATTFLFITRAILNFTKTFAKFAPLLLLIGGIKLSKAIGSFKQGGGLKGLFGGGKENQEVIKAQTKSTEDQTEATKAQTEVAQSQTENIIQHLAALNENTGALTALTNAINRIGNSAPPILAGGDAPAFSGGGKVHKFGIGGLVPGVGRRDTVSAKLTPGEYVIRKDATAAVGTEYLDSINKYGLGGEVLAAPSVAAVAVKGGKRDLIESQIGFKDLTKKIKSDETGQLEKNRLKKIIDKERGQSTWGLWREKVPEELRKSLHNNLEAGIVQGTNTAVAKSAKLMGLEGTPRISGKSRKEFLKGVNDGSVGNMFEQLLTSIENNGEFANGQDPQRAFDFTNGFTNPALKKIFKKASENKFIEARANMNSTTPSDIGPKVASLILNDPDLQEEGQNTKNSSYETLKKKLNELKVTSAGTRFGNKDLGGSPTGALKKDFDAAIANQIISVDKEQVGKSDSKVFKNVFTLLQDIERFREGGSPEGPDTVNALLTPGEYVINRDAAARIGKKRLEELNNADKVKKFNKGGSVGPIQRFAVGGTPEVVAIMKQIADSVGISLDKVARSMGHELQKHFRAFKGDPDQGAVDRGAVEYVARFLKEYSPDKKKNNQLLGNLTGNKLGLKALGPKGSDLPDAEAQEARNAILQAIIENSGAENKTTQQVVQEVNAVKLEAQALNDSVMGLPDEIELDDDNGLSEAAQKLNDAIDKMLEQQKDNEQPAQNNDSKKESSGRREMFPTFKKIGSSIGKSVGGVFRDIKQRILKDGKSLAGAIGKLSFVLGTLVAGFEQIVGQTENEALAGGIGAAKSGLAGAAVGAQLAAQLGLGPVGVAIAGAVGLTVGALKGFSDAIQQVRLDKVLRKVADAGIRVEKAFEALRTGGVAGARDDLLNASADQLEGMQTLNEISGGGTFGERLYDRFYLGALTGQATARNDQGTGLGGLNAAANAFGADLDQESQGILAGISQMITAVSGLDLVVDWMFTNSDAVLQARDALVETQAKMYESALEFTKLEAINASEADLEQARDPANYFFESMKTAAERALPAGQKLTQQQEESLRRESRETLALAAYRKRLSDIGLDSTTIEAKIAQNRAAAVAAGNEVVAQDRKIMDAEIDRTRAMKDAQKVIQNEKDVLDRFNASLRRFGYELERDMQLLDEFIGMDQGATVDRSNEQVIGNLQAYSAEEVAAASAPIAAALGGGQTAVGLQQNLQTVQFLEKRLPALLRNSGGDPGKVADGIEQLREELAAQGLSSESIDKVINQLQTQAETKIGTGTNLEEADLSGIVTEFSDLAKAKQEALANATKLYNDKLQQSIDLQNRYNKAINNARDYLTKAAIVQVEAAQQFADAIGADFNLERANETQRLQVDNLTFGMQQRGGLTPEQAQDPEALGQSMRNLRTETEALEQQQKQIRDVQGRLAADDPRQQGLNDLYRQNATEIRNNSDALSRGREALELVASSGQEASNALRKFEEQQRKAAAGMDYLQGILTGSAADNFKKAGQVAVANQALKGNTAVLQTQFGRESAFAGLDQFKGLLSEKDYNRQRAQLLRTTLTATAGAGALQQQAGPSGMTWDELLSRMENPELTEEAKIFMEASDKQAQANVELAMLEIQSADRIVAEIAKLDDFFNNKFKGILDQALAQAQEVQGLVDNRNQADKDLTQAEAKFKQEEEDLLKNNEAYQEYDEARKDMAAFTKSVIDAQAFVAKVDSEGGPNSQNALQYNNFKDFLRYSGSDGLRRRQNRLDAAAEAVNKDEGVRRYKEAKAERDAALIEKEKSDAAIKEREEKEKQKTSAEADALLSGQPSQPSQPLPTPAPAPSAGGGSIPNLASGNLQELSAMIHSNPNMVARLSAAGITPEQAAQGLLGVNAGNAVGANLGGGASTRNEQLGGVDRLRGIRDDRFTVDQQRMLNGQGRTRLDSSGPVSRAPAPAPVPMTLRERAAAADPRLRALMQREDQEKAKRRARAEDRLRGRPTARIGTAIGQGAAALSSATGGLSDTVLGAVGTYLGGKPGTPGAVGAQPQSLPLNANTMTSNGSRLGDIALAATRGEMSPTTQTTEAQRNVEQGATAAAKPEESMALSIKNFGSYVEQLVNFEFPTLPDTINLVAEHNVNVRFQGAAMFDAMEERVKNLAMSETDIAMAGLWEQSNGQYGYISRTITTSNNNQGAGGGATLT